MMQVHVHGEVYRRVRAQLLRLSTVLWRAWVDVRAWIVRVSGEAENPGPSPPAYSYMC